MTLDFFEFRVLSCVMGLNQVLIKHVFFLFFLEREREAQKLVISCEQMCGNNGGS